jgi:hypothetical protein
MFRGLWTVDCGLWTVDCGPWTVDHGLSYFNDVMPALAVLSLHDALVTVPPGKIYNRNEPG